MRLIFDANAKNVTPGQRREVADWAKAHNVEDGVLCYERGVGRYVVLGHFPWTPRMAFRPRRVITEWPFPGR